MAALDQNAHYSVFIHIFPTHKILIFTLDPQTYITYYHNWLRMAVIGIIPFSAICCLNLRIFLAVRSKPKICWWKNIT